VNVSQARLLQYSFGQPVERPAPTATLIDRQDSRLMDSPVKCRLMPPPLTTLATAQRSFRNVVDAAPFPCLSATATTG
jgi:hypothetical protein